jgi:phosphoribosylanthranilate isomerase
MIKVKVCGMRDPENIRQLVQLDIDFMGFIFYPKSPRYIELSQINKIASLVPSNISKVGVFVNENIQKVFEIASDFNLTYLQLHGSENPDYCRECKAKGFGVIKAFSVDESFDFNNTIPYSEVADYFLFDTISPMHGGTGIKFDWNILKKYTINKPFFLSGGITAEDAETIASLNMPQLYTVDINSKFEIQPALKDVTLINEFIKKIKNL